MGNGLLNIRIHAVMTKHTMLYWIWAGYLERARGLVRTLGTASTPHRARGRQLRLSGRTARRFLDGLCPRPQLPQDPGRVVCRRPGCIGCGY